LEVLEGGGCFIVHRKNIQLLGINVCFKLLSQHKHQESEGVTMTWTQILQTRQNWYSYLPNKAVVREVIFFSECKAASNV
jgi:hypothetical protein